jgi:hypothetical protein
VSDGVDGDVGEDGGVARSDTLAVARDTRRAAELSGCRHGRWRGRAAVCEAKRSAARSGRGGCQDGRARS